MKIQKNIVLAPYTTFGIGGPADYFCQTKSKEEIIEAIKWAKEKKIVYFILGKGSNILISDKGLSGLVIKIQYSVFSIPACRSLACTGRQYSGSKIIAGSGLTLVELLQYSIKHNLSSIECLAGIPGTVGGAIVGNAGTKNGSISKSLEKVSVLGEDGLIYDLNNKECQFAYRQSRFQKSKEVILEAIFALKKDKPEVIKKRINQALKTRKNQPKGKSVGSIFKNSSDYTAGYLIEQVGLKGKKIGGAMISEKHANWIINLKDAKATDVVELMSLIKDKVKKKFNIILEEEIVLVGEF